MQDFGLTTSRQSSSSCFFVFWLESRLSIGACLMDKLYGHWPKVGSNERSLSTGQLAERSPKHPQTISILQVLMDQFLFSCSIWHGRFHTLSVGIPLFMEWVYKSHSEPSYYFTSARVMRSNIAKLFRQHLSPKNLLKLSLSYPHIPSKVWEDEFPAKRWDMFSAETKAAGSGHWFGEVSVGNPTFAGCWCHTSLSHSTGLAFHGRFVFFGSWLICFGDLAYMTYMNHSVVWCQSLESFNTT